MSILHDLPIRNYFPLNADANDAAGTGSLTVLSGTPDNPGLFTAKIGSGFRFLANQQQTAGFNLVQSLAGSWGFSSWLRVYERSVVNTLLIGFTYTNASIVHSVHVYAIPSTDTLVVLLQITDGGTPISEVMYTAALPVSDADYFQLAVSHDSLTAGNKFLVVYNDSVLTPYSGNGDFTMTLGDVTQHGGLFNSNYSDTPFILDEFVVYNAPITEADISALYNNGTGVDLLNLGEPDPDPDPEPEPDCVVHHTYSIAAKVASSQSFVDLVDAGTGPGVFEFYDVNDVLLGSSPMTRPPGYVNPVTGSVVMATQQPSFTVVTTGDASYVLIRNADGLTHLTMPCAQSAQMLQGRVTFQNISFTAGNSIPFTGITIGE